MTRASRIDINDVDNSFVAQRAAVGISGFVGRFTRGPINDPSDLITSPQMLRRIFGSQDSGTGDLLLADRVLNNGGSLRIVNVAHYEDIADPSSLTAVTAATLPVVNAEDQPIFNLIPKYPGINPRVIITARANSFDLEIVLPGEENFTREVYRGLQHNESNPAVASYLAEIAEGSRLVTPEYLAPADDEDPQTDFLPKVQTLEFTGGTMGPAPVADDYAGSSVSRTGFYAFDPYSDMLDFAAPSITDVLVNIAGASYAEMRQDMEFLAALPNSLTSVASIIAARELITVNSKYYSVWAGGLVVRDPVKRSNVEITSVADVMAVGHRNDTDGFPWFSQASAKRGQIFNALGVVNNFGSPSSFADLDALARAGINVTVSDRGQVAIRGNYSGQTQGTSKASYRNIARLLIYIKKSLRPTLERYLDEPADFPTFKNLYNEVNPLLRFLEDNRAVHPGGIIWKGDQDASKMSELKINTPEDIRQGIYSVELHLDPVMAINTIILNLSLNSGNGTLDIQEN